MGGTRVTGTAKMLKSSSTLARMFARLSVVTLAVALVLVPTLARARQSVEHRDATRLSIKHSWVGVAPPSKASVAPRPVLVSPALTPPPQDERIATRPPVIADPAPRVGVLDSSDPLRGPPSTSRS